MDLEGVSLEQLRTLAEVAAAGSFSAAARAQRKAQSAVSSAMGNLERQLGVVIWDRRPRVPTLTANGRAVLAAARRVLAEAAALAALTRGLAGGLEASVALCVDALFPLPALVALCRDFAVAFPGLELGVRTEVMSAVSQAVLRGEATLGVISPRGLAAGLERQPLSTVRLQAVVGARHPLARLRGKLSTAQLAEHVQVVLAERGGVGVADQAVLSPRTWRVADLHTKQALLLANLGWGNLPEHLIRDDVRRRRLVVIQPRAWGRDEHRLQLSAVWRPGTPLGPAHRWVLERLATLCARAVA